MKRSELVLLAALGLFFAVGFAAHLVPPTRALVIRLTPLALLASGAAAVAPLASERRIGALAWTAVCLAAGYGVEVAGVATGAIFGIYRYGTVLGPRLLEVPLLIGLNWAVVVLGAAALVSRATGFPPLIAVATGLITAGFDWVLEPVAVALGYWSWHLDVIPLRNYVAWFAVSALLALGWGLGRLRVRSWLPTAVLALEAVFFASLRLALPH